MTAWTVVTRYGPATVQSHTRRGALQEVARIYGLGVVEDIQSVAPWDGYLVKTDPDDRVFLEGVPLPWCHERMPKACCFHCTCFHWWNYGEDGGNCCACQAERTPEEKETWRHLNP